MVPPVPSFVPTASYVGTQKEMIIPSRSMVSLAGQGSSNSFSRGEAEMKHEAHDSETPNPVLTLTFTGLSKNGKAAFYSGAARQLRLPVGLFAGQPPASFSVANGIFVAKAVKVAKKKLTKEERAALPKPTLAEKIAKKEAQIARLKASLQEEQSQPAI